MCEECPNVSAAWHQQPKTPTAERLEKLEAVARAAQAYITAPPGNPNAVWNDLVRALATLREKA